MIRTGFFGVKTWLQINPVGSVLPNQLGNPRSRLSASHQRWSKSLCQSLNIIWL